MKKIIALLLLAATSALAQTNRPLQDLTTLASPASGDLLYVVDVSSANASRKLTLGSFQSWLTIPIGQVTGTVPYTQGGTGLTSATDDNIMVGNGTGWSLKAVPDCTDTGGNHLNYTASTNTISCGTSGGGSGTVTSVAASGGTTGMTWSGSPVTTTGTLTLGGTLALANGGTQTSLSDPGADRIWYWEDTQGASFADFGPGLQLSGSYPNKTIGLSVAPLANGGTGESLSDPGADRIMGWDDSAGDVIFYSFGTGISTSGTVINATGATGLGGLYGDAADGSVTISSGTTTITDNNKMTYDSLTINGTGKLSPQGRVIFVAETLDLSSAPSLAFTANGVAASGSTAGAVYSGLTGRQTPASLIGSNGGGSTATNGFQAGSSASLTGTIITDLAWGNTSSGGVGGASGVRTGGVVRNISSPSTVKDLIVIPPQDPSVIGAWVRVADNNAISSAISLISGMIAPGGTGGGGGAGNGTLSGTSGGGGGSPGDSLIVYARQIKIGASTATCVFSAAGGNGGDSTNASNTDTAAGGGGGGGHGGLIIIVTDRIYADDATSSVSGAICATGGYGGSAGTSNGTASNAAGGYSGGGGRILLWNRGTGELFTAGPNAGVANSGRTGGTPTAVDMALTAN